MHLPSMMQKNKPTKELMDIFQSRLWSGASLSSWRLVGVGTGAWNYDLWSRRFCLLLVVQNMVETDISRRTMWNWFAQHWEFVFIKLNPKFWAIPRRAPPMHPRQTCGFRPQPPAPVRYEEAANQANDDNGWGVLMRVVEFPGDWTRKNVNRI